jgi:TRAP-type C4-dicarboxylate transport system permease small subunit
MRRIAWIAWRALANAQRFLIFAICFFLILFITSEVIMRYLIHYPGMEVEEIATLIAFWFYFIGASYGAYNRTHIKAEMMHLVFKTPKKLALSRSIATFLTLALAGVMVYWGYLYFIWGITKGERSRILQIPMVFSQISIFLSASLMFFYFLAELIDRLRQAAGKNPIFLQEDESQ